MRKIVELNLEMLKEKQDDKEDNNIEEQEEVEEEKLPPLTGEEYINILLNYVNENHITIEDYYRNLALSYIRDKEPVIEEFERRNPFLTEEDIERLVKSKSYPKYIRNIFKNVETQISWNISLPFRINKNGKIKKNLKSKVLDDIRNSYGIDLTLEIELEKEALNIEKERLKSTINNLKSKNDKENLVRYKNTLSRFLNRNDTYNKYSLRRKKFNYNNLDRMVASFLIVTGQVEYGRNLFLLHLQDRSQS